MKKYILMILFFLNFAFVFQEGKMEVSVGMEMKAQSYSQEQGDEPPCLICYEMPCACPVCSSCGQRLNNIGCQGHAVIVGSPGCAICHEEGHKSIDHCQYCGQYGCSGPCYNCGECGCDGPCSICGECGCDGPCEYCWECDCDGECLNSCSDGSTPCINGHCGCKGPTCTNCWICSCQGECLPPDCNGDIGGSAFIDECEECVGGNTGKAPCDECAEMSDDLAAIFEDSEDGGLMAVKRMTGVEIPTESCCPDGSIQVNGKCIPYNSINTENTYGLNTHAYTTKKSYTHFEALDYFIKQRNISSAMGGYGLIFPAGSILTGKIIDKIKNFSIKWGGRTAGMVCTVATAYWESYFKRQESIYQDLHDMFSYTHDNMGLYEIKTQTTMVSPNGYSSTTTQISYYTTDGCLFKQIFY